ncbi:unnamed protein product [Nezara viridula]|uniref:Uncharacterized protein n=1 Tax=Nezara viridula TaxID=85310 RepID=A0A9P0HBU7_NEZVI|nr:unnamed protein product [Nezara viridula]
MWSLVSSTMIFRASLSDIKWKKFLELEVPETSRNP